MSEPALRPDEGPGPAAFMSCSECRAPMRDRYYVVNERPVCAKCSPAFARRIKLTDGEGAMMRVAMQGVLVALAGIVGLTLVGIVFPAARIFLVVPIGYFIGKRMMSSLEGYSAPRYQKVAVTLTYLSLLIGFAIPGVMAERETRERRAEMRSKMQGTMATQADAFQQEVDALTAQRGDSLGGVSDEQAAAARARAARLAAAKADSRPSIGLQIITFVLYPVMSMVQFGMMFSAVSLLALGYSLYLAWKQTDGQGMELKLSGPFRVGQGPIAAR